MLQRTHSYSNTGRSTFPPVSATTSLASTYAGRRRAAAAPGWSPLPSPPAPPSRSPASGMRPRRSSRSSSSAARTARPAAAPRRPSPSSAPSATGRRCAATRRSASTSCSASRTPPRSARSAAPAPPPAPATARRWPPACGTPMPSGSGRSRAWHTVPQPPRPELGGRLDRRGSHLQELPWRRGAWRATPTRPWRPRPSLDLAHRSAPATETAVAADRRRAAGGTARRRRSEGHP